MSQPEALTLIPAQHRPEYALLPNGRQEIRCRVVLPLPDNRANVVLCTVNAIPETSVEVMVRRMLSGIQRVQANVSDSDKPEENL